MKIINWQSREFLNNDIIIEGMNNFHPALNEYDLKNMIFYDNVICEDVYRNETFKDFYEFLKSNSSSYVYLTTDDIKNYFEINSKIFKKLNKLDSRKHQLYICICDLSNESIFLKLKDLCKNMISIDLLIEKSKEIQNNISSSTKGFFTRFKDNEFFGILFLNEKFDITTLSHEFIHYFNWACGNHSQATEAEPEYYEEEISLIKNYLNRNFSEANFLYFTNSNEYETLLNDFCKELNSIKTKYFNDLSDYNFAKMICNDIVYKSGNEIFSREDYLLNVRNLKYFNYLKNKPSFLMIVFFVLIQYKVMNIKNHIFGYFSR